MTNEKWFVLEGDEELGPLGPNGLRKWLREGRIRRDTRLRRQDQTIALRADQVQALFPRATQRVRTRPRSAELRGQPKAAATGPFRSLARRARGVFAAMASWVGVACYGLVEALRHHRHAHAIAAGASHAGRLLGVGAIALGALLAVTAALTIWWLWTARVNLPHLVSARVHFGASWAIAGWLLPPLLLWRPFEVVDEVDRLSAEAAADGDPRVQAQRALLVPWWLSTIAAGAVGVRCLLLPADDPAVGGWQVAFAVLLLPAAALTAAVVLRISRLQQRARRDHDAPIALHHGNLHPHGDDTVRRPGARVAARG